MASSSDGGLKPLERGFFNRPPERVAPELIGKWLVRRREGEPGQRARIVETEAYLGVGDAAAHSAAGRTARNATIFGPPGHAYVYRIYGLHWCLNVSTQPPGVAGCVLLRALEAGDNEADPRRYSGPGKLTRALGVDRSLDGTDLTRLGPLYLAAAGRPAGEIVVTARVGIGKAMELPLRFYLKGAAAVSGPRAPILATMRVSRR